MAAVDVVRRLSGLVGPVQQAAIFRVPEEELSQSATPPPDRDVEGRVSFLQAEVLYCLLSLKVNICFKR